MTNEQAKSELMQIYMSLSEEKKRALDVLMAQNCDQCEAGNPCLYCEHEFKAQADRNEFYNWDAPIRHKADGEYISKSDMIDWLKDIRSRIKPQGFHTASEFEIAENQILNLIQMLQMGAFPTVAIPSAEPCEDAISREELLKAIDTWDKFGVDDTNSLFRLDNLSLPHYVPYIHYDDVVKCIKGMPSVKPQEPQTEWIPIEWKPFGKNGYPKPEDEYKHFLTIDDKGEITIQEFLLSLDEEPQPYFTGMRKVIAWMPLPKPYEPQESEVNNG